MTILEKWVSDEEQMQDFMKFMHCTYGQKFRDQWRGSTPNELKGVWGTALHGYSVIEVKRGMQECLRRPWPPTLPEFLSLCRPPLNAEATFREASVQWRKRFSDGTDAWSSPAVYWTAQAIGNDVSKEPWDRMRTRWTEALADIQEAIAAGRIQNAVPAALTALPPAISTLSVEKIRERSAELREQVAGGITNKKPSLEWARKILASPSGRAPITLQFAKDALAAGSHE